jgi:hypothetical protein
MKEISLTRGKVALVDDEDFDYLNQFNWYCTINNYACRSIRKSGRRIVRMHRVITNPPDGFEVDHINMNKLDNRRENLRICNRSQNQSNRLAQKNSTTGYKGVYKNRNKWTSQIQNHKTLIHLGTFDNIDDARKAYINKAKKLFGEFARGE